MLHRFSDIYGHIGRKSPSLAYSACIWRPHLGGCIRISLRSLASENLESMGYRVVLFCVIPFCRFGAIPALDGRTDGHRATAYTALAYRRAAKTGG